jgi:hypothetical protein
MPSKRESPSFSTSGLALLVFTVALFLLSFVPSWFIARSAAAPGEDINWDVFGVIGTAVGTLLLAIATVFLARSTNRAVQLQLEDQRLHRSPLVIHDVSRVRAATVQEARQANLESGGLAISVRLVNAGEGPATDVRGDIVYAATDEVVLDTVDAAVILPGSEREFITIVSGAVLALPVDTHFEASRLISVVGSFSDPRADMHGAIKSRVAEVGGRGTLARSGERDMPTEQPPSTSVVPRLTSWQSGGGTVPAMSISVTNGGPGPARRVTAGIEVDGVEYAIAGEGDPLPAGQIWSVDSKIPPALLVSRSVEELQSEVSTWARYGDGEGRFWRTVRRPDSELTTTEEVAE